MAATELKARRRASVWWLAAVGGLVALALAPAGLRDALLLRRGGVAQGELWRLWSGHWVHFGWSHLFWDAGTFLLAGFWLERLGAGRVTGQLLLWAAPLLSLGVLALTPGLEVYGGLSGLVCAQVAALGVRLWRNRQVTPAVLVLALLAVKLVAELGTGQTAFSQFAGTPVRTVPAAHLLGTLLGLAWDRVGRFIAERSAAF